MNFIFGITLITAACIAVARGDGRNPDGSYSTGYSYQGQGSTGDSIYALLTKANGWTQNTADSNVITVDESSPQIPNLISSSVELVKNVPFVEILKLVEAFLRIKGEIAAQLNALRIDNMHIINAVAGTLIAKIPLLHRFTLGAVIGLRKIFEYASTILSGVNVNVSAGFH